MTIFKGDDTNAFGNNFITIGLISNITETISKAVFQCGDIKITVTAPTFPLNINLTAAQTKLLDKTNVCYLAVYDENNRKLTCEGQLSFNAKEEAVVDE